MATFPPSPGSATHRYDEYRHRSSWPASEPAIPRLPPAARGTVGITGSSPVMTDARTNAPGAAA